MLSILLSMACGLVAGAATPTDRLALLFNAIRSVETGGVANSRDAVGDGGRSIGPYQISLAYWKDSGLGGSWARCKDRHYSETVMRAYWKRYCPDALRLRDDETLARVHNGGPTGHLTASTRPYWRMVSARLAARAVALPHRSAAQRS